MIENTRSLEANAMMIELNCCEICEIGMPNCFVRIRNEINNPALIV